MIIKINEILHSKLYTIVTCIYAEVVTYVAGSLEAVRIANLSPTDFLLNKHNGVLTKICITYTIDTRSFNTQNVYIIGVNTVQVVKVEGW